MKIINKKVSEHILLGKPLALDLGSGRCPREGMFSVDCREIPGVDIVADLNENLQSIPDESVNHIYSHHAFEHVENLAGLMKEIYRISSRECIIEIIVPHFSNTYSYSDPTHVRFFGLFSFYYFSPFKYRPKRIQVPMYQSDLGFIVKEIVIQFYRMGVFDKIVGRLIEPIVNINLRTQELYERRFSRIYHAMQIKYVLSPIKGQKFFT
jgi:hypothetical protein